MKIVEQSAELLWITPNPEKMIELAGRTCYFSFDKITDDSASIFTKKMYKSGHHSVIEHAIASFRIITNRAISHEIVRHRIASYSERSTRYCNFSDGKFDNEISVIQPIGLNDIQFDSWERLCEDSESVYFYLLKNGCESEVARDVLPNCLSTEIVMTCNFREWIHFIKMRGSMAAHPQVREIARMIRDELKKHSSIFDIEIYGDKK